MMKTTAILALAFSGMASAKVYLDEKFDAGWEDRWTVPTEWKSESELGEWTSDAGEWHADPEDKGIKTSQDAKFYGLTAELDSEFDNEGKDMIVQYTVKLEQKIDCGGAYIKLLPKDTDQKSFGGDSPYQVMFGPDICGSSTKKTHVIFNYNDENLLTKNEPKCETDTKTHVYRLTVKSDNTYDVSIDGTSQKSGDLADDFDFLKPKEIKDPEQSKPSDWVDEKKIPDPEVTKPEGYDDIPEEIPDPEAEQPEDWDEEDDGEWEPPMISNPEYKGPWTHPMIDNPEYKGPWVHPMIPNPEYEFDESMYHRCNPCTHVGFELWQVKAGTIFDDILITDSVEEADAALKIVQEKIADEKTMFDELEAEKKQKAEEERKKAEEERKKKEAEEAEDEDEDEDEEEEEVKDEL